MLNQNELEYLRTLVFNDLKLKFTGESIESLLSCGYIHFNIPKQDVQFRRNMLTKLMSIKIENNQIKSSSTPFIEVKAINLAKRLTAAQINTISTCIIEQKKLKAIKMFRTYTGLGLRDAKEFMDMFIPMNPLPSNFSYITAANRFSDICV